MPDRQPIETTPTGYQRVAAVRVQHRGPDGSFVTAAEFERRRDAAIRAAGYGTAGCGLAGYGR